MLSHIRFAANHYQRKLDIWALWLGIIFLLSLCGSGGQISGFKSKTSHVSIPLGKINMDTLDEKVKDWIEKTGFPFEMQVANAFLSADFMVAQSVYYKDSELGKFREADIIAHTYKNINGIWLNLTFVVECKSSQDKPWVVMTNEYITNSIENELPNYMTRNFNRSLSVIQQVCDFKSDLLFKNNRHFGYALLTALNSGNDKAYEALQSVTKACEHFMVSTNNSPRKACNLYFPIIVIQGILYSAKLLKEGDVELSRIKSSELFLTRSFHDHGNSIVRIFDNTDLKTTAKSLKGLCDEIFEHYTSIIEKNIW